MSYVVPDETHGFRCITCEDNGLAWWLCRHMGGNEQRTCAQVDARQMTTIDLVSQSNFFCAKRHVDLRSDWSEVEMIRWRAIEAELESRRFERDGVSYIHSSAVQR